MEVKYSINTKYTELVEYKDVIKISHRVLQWYITSIMYFIITFFPLPKIVPPDLMGLVYVTVFQKGL